MSLKVKLQIHFGVFLNTLLYKVTLNGEIVLSVLGWRHLYKNTESKKEPVSEEIMGRQKCLGNRAQNNQSHQLRVLSQKGCLTKQGG